MNAKPVIEFGFRGEDIIYRDADRVIEISFTHINGPRLYTETIDSWKDETPLTEQEKAHVFAKVLPFVKRGFAKPNVVINTDDPSRAFWEQQCATQRALIGKLEYTSDADQAHSLRSTLLKFVGTGKLVIDETEIEDEQALDRYLSERKKKRRPKPGESTP